MIGPIPALAAVSGKKRAGDHHPVRAVDARPIAVEGIITRMYGAVIRVDGPCTVRQQAGRVAQPRCHRIFARKQRRDPIVQHIAIEQSARLTLPLMPRAGDQRIFAALVRRETVEQQTFTNALGTCDERVRPKQSRKRLRQSSRIMQCFSARLRDQLQCL